MIDLRGIIQIYPGPQGPVEALRGIDLHITPGEVFEIEGLAVGLIRNTMLM